MKINNGCFTVFRSLDGANWYHLMAVLGVGDSYTLRYYSIADHPHWGTSYYRINQADFDVHFSYSATRSVTLTERSTHSQSIVYPNPFSNSATLTLGSYWEDKDLQIEIYDSSGNRVQHYTNSSYKTTLRRENLKSGRYMSSSLPEAGYPFR